MIVTIDGPAGAGKSSAAKSLAERLGFEFLDTGAMYRAVALAGLRAKVDFSNEPDVTGLLGSIQLVMSGGQVLLNDRDVAGEIRLPEVSAVAGQIAVLPNVRNFLVELQRQIAAERRMVCEGRDQGTVVFPEALCKFFLTAAPEERARRRFDELQANGQQVSLDGILADQQTRDKRDAERSLSPLKPADDAVVIDSSGMTLEQVVDRMEQETVRCMNG